MNDSAFDERAQLQHLVASVMRKYRDHGTIDEDELGRAERLKRLLAMVPAPKNKHPMRLIVVLAFAFVLMVMAVLSYVRLPRSEVEVTANTSTVTFTMNGDQLLSRLLGAEMAFVSGAQRISLSPYGLNATRDLSGLADDTAIVVRRDNSQSSISIPPILVRSGTIVVISLDRERNVITLELNGPDNSVELSLAGSLFFESPTIERATVTPSAPLPLELTGKHLIAELTLQTLPDCIVCQPVTVSDIKFETLDEYSTPTGTVLRRISNIRGGAVFFESLNGKSYPIRAEEALIIDHPDGAVRSIGTSDKGDLVVDFHGHVSGLTMGTFLNPRPLTPSTLEWLAERHTLTLVWTSSVYLLGLLLALIKWWGVDSV